MYNGYFAADFENQIARMPLILEPVIPNLYIVDFANTSISEYYELLSLNAGVDSYPNGYISEFNASYPLGTPAYQSLFEPFGYTRTICPSPPSARDQKLNPYEAFVAVSVIVSSVISVH